MKHTKIKIVKHALNFTMRFRHKRFFSLLLCLIMILGSFSTFPAIAVTGSSLKAVSVWYEGNKIERLTLPENEKAELTAQCSPNIDGIKYQWQILADLKEELWVNIYDGTGEQLAVSYAMLQALLDASGSAYIRCRATFGGDECTSEPVCVTVEYMPKFSSTQAAVSAAKTQLLKQNVLRASAQNSDEQLVSITINYLDGISGLPIYSAYTGHVNVSNEDYTAKVISPTYLGYAPMYCKDDPAKLLPDTSGTDHSALFPDSAVTIDLNITQETAEQYTVNVYYFAIDVPYAVRFYFQNIHDDQYTENVGLYRTDTAKTGTIISNEKLAELAGDEATFGFTKLYHYPEAVAADGSTVFECYYDRNYRMLKFDSNGGYGVEPIYARYGTPFLVNEPIRHGYVFAGWDKIDKDGNGDETADVLPATVPNENCTYRAIWKQANTSYDVAYWLQNADNNDYSYIGTVKVSDVLSGIDVTPDNAPLLEEDIPICGNSEADHEHNDNDCYARHAKHYVLDKDENAGIKVTVNGDGSSVLNVYYTRKYYTLRFIYAKETKSGSTQSASYSVVGGSTYGFGNQAYSTWFNKDYTLDEILDNVGDWGEIQSLPTPNDPAGAHYVTGTYSADDSSNECYHFFEITARYGADLTKLWPTDVFKKVPVKNPETHTDNGASGALDNDGWGRYAFLAGWNGEYKVQYTIQNENSTIKGLYQKLDDSVLLGNYNGTKFNYTDERQIETKTTVSGEKVDSNVCYFLAFFDNGANIGWSVPREWIYELFVPVFEQEAPQGSALRTAIIRAANNSNTAYRTYKDTESGNTYYYYKRKIYRLYSRIVASDDNTIKSTSSSNGQTQTVLTGFDFDDDYSTPSDWFEQFQNADLSDGRQSFTSRFFYTRDTFTITLHSHGSVFDSSLREYDSEMDDYMVKDGKLIEPPYPDTLEENAYYFDGWYASPECVDGTQYVEGSGYLMPAVDVALYAKWTPKTHTINFFQTHDDLLRYEQNGNTSGLIETRKVKHGQVLGSVNNPSDKSKFHYTFGGWFYDYFGKRFAYTPLDVPVVRDMNVFAAWGSLTAQPYRIHYALDEAETQSEWQDLLAAVNAPLNNNTYTVTNGTEVRRYVYLASDKKFHLCIADDTDGFAYQGSTRTFSPKAGDPYNQLYQSDTTNYNKGYYPTLANHSITMEYEENKEDPSKNVFTFTYVHKSSVDYTVEYRYADTNALIESVADKGKALKSTQDGVITERFVTVKNYIPDTFFKRLILAVEKNENGEYVSSSANVIVFYYTKNTTSAYYAVHYMLQNLGASSETIQQNGKFINYTESAAHTEGIGNIGQVCSIPPQTFSGFTVQDTALIDAAQPTTISADESGKPCFNITVSENGSELYIFYTRNTQQYKVYYLQYDKVKISDLASLKYTDGTNGVLKEIKNGEAQFGATVTESAQNISIGGMTCISSLTQSILIRSNNDQNYIIFYYTPVQTTIEYRVWEFGGGTLDTTLEVFDAEAGEIKGSKATALDGYYLEGWYLDAACTQPADANGTVDGTHFMPNGNLLAVMPQVNIFYAKFLPINGSLTITRKNGENDESNADQVFVYKIQANNDPDYVIYATITGNGSVTIKDLPCREYTVTQENGWSWRYDDYEQTVAAAQDGAEVIFEKTAVKQNWLNGNSKKMTNKKR